MKYIGKNRFMNFLSSKSNAEFRNMKRNYFKFILIHCFFCIFIKFSNLSYEFVYKSLNVKSYFCFLIVLVDALCEKYHNFPNFLVWKFCKKTQFLHSFGWMTGNCAFPQNFQTRKFGEITVFFEVTAIVEIILRDVVGTTTSKIIGIIH